MRTGRGYSILELLVVIGIVVILLAILFPAIGGARDRSMVLRSQSNLRQLAISHAAYAAAHNDEQWCNIPHQLAAYGNSLSSAMTAFAQTGQLTNSDHGSGHTWLTTLGWAHHPSHGTTRTWVISGRHAALPIIFESSDTLLKWGSFRLINVKSFNQYVSGRFYDATFYAPKDRAVIDAIGQCYDAPGEFCLLPGSNPGTPFGLYRAHFLFSSYILSPAAMFDPNVFSHPNAFTIEQMWSLPSAFRSPTFAQARYPDLKTHMLEHHWLQHLRHPCNPQVPESELPNGCEPYLFNGGFDSIPATLFYDGHVDMLSLREVIDANSNAIARGGPKESLWHTGTPVQDYEHYFHKYAYTAPGTEDFSKQTSSYHVFTRYGILGRDRMSK